MKTLKKLFISFFITLVSSYVLLIILANSSPIERSYYDSAKLVVKPKGLYRDPLNYLEEVIGTNRVNIIVTSSPIGTLASHSFFNIVLSDKGYYGSCPDPAYPETKCEIIFAKNNQEYHYYPQGKLLATKFSANNYITAAFISKNEDKNTIQNLINSISYVSAN